MSTQLQVTTQTTWNLGEATVSKAFPIMSSAPQILEALRPVSVISVNFLLSIYTN